MRSPYGLDLVESCVTCKLRKTEFFCGFSRATLTLLDQVKLANVFPKGAVLFAAGQKPSGVHLVCAGKVKLCAPRSSGRSLVFKLANPGTALGLHACIAGAPHEFHAETVEPSHIVFIKGEDFRQCLQQNADMRWRTALWLAQQCREAHEMLRSSQRTHSASEKLARLLLQVSSLGTSTREGLRVKLPFTHKELAQAIGMSRETVWRKLVEFRAQGLASLHGSVLFIRDRAALQRLAGR